MNREIFSEGLKRGITLTEKERRDILYESIRKSGIRMKLIIAMEECAELTQEISKCLRCNGNANGLMEEMVDVYICLYNLQRIFDISGESILKAIDVKIMREKERLG